MTEIEKLRNVTRMTVLSFCQHNVFVMQTELFEGKCNRVLKPIFFQETYLRWKDKLSIFLWIKIYNLILEVNTSFTV